MSRSQTYLSPLWPCPECGGTERWNRGLNCVACFPGKTYRKNPPAELQPDPLKALEDAAYQPAKPVTPESKRDCEIRAFRPRIVGEWPPGINYGGNEELGLNDNTYPNTAPYNYTHKPNGYFTSIRVGSTASDAVNFAERL